MARNKTANQDALRTRAQVFRINEDEYQALLELMRIKKRNSISEFVRETLREEMDKYGLLIEAQPDVVKRAS